MSLIYTVPPSKKKKKCVQGGLSFAAPCLHKPQEVKHVYVVDSPLLVGQKAAVEEPKTAAPTLEGRKRSKAVRRLPVLQPSEEAITELGDDSCIADNSISTSSSTTVIADSSSPFPAIWTDEVWANKKEIYPWLDCKDGKLGCSLCSSVSGLSVPKAIGAHLSDHWTSYNIAPNGKEKVQMLKSLRTKISTHRQTHFHKAAEEMQVTAKEECFQLGDDSWTAWTPDESISTCSSTTVIADSSSSSPFPAIWTDEVWANKKEIYPWLDCKDGKLGCSLCSSGSDLSVPKAIGAHLSDYWTSYNIAPNGKEKVQMLKSLRTKISTHRQSHFHKAAEEMQATAKVGATCAVFNSAYFLAQNNRPLSGHYDLLKLQEKNGVDIGISLHSRFSAARIIDHLGTEMRKKICKTIQALEGKISIMIEKSTALGETTLIVCLNGGTEKSLEPHTVFLDLIEVPDQREETITNHLLKCLTGHGFNHAYLKKHLVAFASDGASVTLGRKSGVAKQMSDLYPDILTWHWPVNMAVGDTVKDVSGVTVNHFQAFIHKLHSVYKLITTPIRTKLLVKQLSALMFIKLHGPPVEDWDPTDYVISWNRCHRLAEDTRTRAVPETHKAIPDRCWKFL